MNSHYLVLAAVLVAASPARAQEHDHSQMNHGSSHAQEPQSVPDGHNGHASVPSTEGSGTSRLPGLDGGMHGWHAPVGDGWHLMAHGTATFHYTDHSGPRGDAQPYITTMAMVTGEKDTSWGAIQLRSMLSLEPLMSARGYPNLFATGETANGEPLVDRQHPHDLFMELAARVDVNVAPGTAVFAYAGPVGEPALGPSAFMHRRSGTTNPEPPITHHWFDSTHITYGVVTMGVSNRTLQVEVSAFRGREPDEARWNIETPKLDSWSVRATWTPSPAVALQLSTGRLKSPEASHPEDDEQRTTASVHYSTGTVSAMAAFSNKNILHEDEDSTAWLAEVNWDITKRHSLFGRFESVLNRELFPDHDDPLHDQGFRVSRLQAGYAHHIPLTGMVRISIGGSVNAYLKPDALDAAYGRNPWGYTLFSRLSLGH